METQRINSSLDGDPPKIFLRTHHRVVRASISNYSAKYFVLKIDEDITLKELDKKRFLDFELSLNRCIKVVVRGKVKQSLGEGFFLFEVGQLDHFQEGNFIGSGRIIHPIVSFYDEDHLSHAGLLEEISAYEMALSLRSLPKNLSIGQTFTGVYFQLGLSGNSSAKLFLKEITSDQESYILVFQISGVCPELRHITSMLSVLNHRGALSPIFYNKNILEKRSQSILPQILDKMYGAHMRLALGLPSEESVVSDSGGDISMEPAPPNRDLKLTYEDCDVAYGNFHCSNGSMDLYWFDLSKKLCQETSTFTFKSLKSDYRKESPDYISFENPFISPQWTKPDLAPSILTSYITVADEMIGVQKTNQCLLDLGVDRSYFANPSNWVSVEFFDEFIERASRHCDVVEWHKRSGRKLAGTGFLEVRGFLPGLFCHPNISFKNVGRLFPRFNRVRTYSYKKVNHVGGLVRIGLVERQKLPKDSHSCENWRASLETYIKLITGSSGQVRKLTCCYRGDESCDYKVSWSPIGHRRLIIFFIPTVVFLLPWLYIQNGLRLIWPVLLAGFFFKLLFSFKKERDSLMEELNRQQENSFQRYKELQDSKNKAYDMYHEAKIISEVTSRVHSFDKVGNILTPTLKDICVQLKYNRAFVMLSDSSGDFLKTKSAYGLRGEGLKIWNYKVHLKSEIETVKFISTTFQTGQSLLLTDLESRYSDLDEESRPLVNVFKSEDICMVPVKANEESVGVLIVGRKKEVGTICRRDLTLLERLSQTLGLSIEKERRYERECLLRQSFQKFVPTEWVEDLLNKKTGVLKGEEKSIAVAFVDIRGFTELTSEVPAQKLVYLLNRFYSITNMAAKNTGGIIDKLLGDGVLILWGVYGEYSDKESRALEFFGRLKKGLVYLNDENSRLCFPELKIGVGMSSGKAVVGTLGDDIKMEYTAVGPVVNLASRLEDLCKVHGSECVVSVDFLDGLRESERQRFALVEEQQISGMGRNIHIGMMR